MRKIESIDGVKVISQQPAQAPHPHPAQNGRVVPFTNVVHLLLEDGTELFACEICDKTYTGPQSVVAHLSSHFRTPGPVTSVETIKKVLLAVRAVDPHNERYRYRIAADELNRHGHTTFHGNAWTVGSVSNIFRTYADQYPDVQPTVMGRRRTTRTPVTPISQTARKNDVTTSMTTSDTPTTVTAITADTRPSEGESDLDRLERLVTQVSDEAVIVAETLDDVAAKCNSLSNHLMEARKIVNTLRRGQESDSVNAEVREALAALQRLVGGTK